MDRLLTAEEVATRLGVRPQWVWAQARAGRIPHVRLGRYRRFRESAIEAWIFDLERESRQPASNPIGRPRDVRRIHRQAPGIALDFRLRARGQRMMPN